MAPGRKAPQAVPFWTIAAILGTSLGVVLLLIPNHGTLLKRQIKDGAYEDALESLEKVSPSDRKRDPREFLKIELELRRRLLGNGIAAEPLREQMLAAAAGCLKYAHDPALLQELLFRIPYTPSAQQAWAWLAPLYEMFSATERSAISQRITDRALAANDPRGAALLREQLRARYPESEEHVTEVVRLWRLAGQPEMGLKAISRGASKGNPKLALSPALSRLRIELLRELGRASDAFEATRELYELSAPKDRDALFPELTQNALAAGRYRDLDPFVRQRAEERPADPDAWRQLARLMLDAGDQPGAIESYRKVRALDPRDASSGLQLGQLLEWNNRAPEAFDLYASLVQQGVESPLGRLISLNRGLYRDEALAALFQGRAEAVHTNGFGLEAARLFFRIADYAESQKHYERHLSRYPEDFDVRLEYGLSLMNMFEYDRALKIFQEADRLKPGDEKVMHPMAEALVQLGRFREALGLFKKLTGHSDDPSVMTQYINLANALGELGDVIHGLKLRIAQPGATPRDYLTLGFVQNQAKQKADSRKSLREGVRRFPTDPDLILQAAYADGNAGDFLDASHLLVTHPELHTQIEVVEYYTSLLLQAQDFASASRFLANVKNPAALESPSMIEARAQIAEANKQIAQAAVLYERLYRSDPKNLLYVMNHARMLSTLGRAKEARAIVEPYLVRPTRQILKLAAQVFGAAGDPKAAEALQKRYLASAPPDLPEAWGFLGDIMLSRGDRVSAKRAYRHGVDTLMTRLANNP